MVVDMPYAGTTVYDGHATYISDINKLPHNIIEQINNLLKRRMGTFSNKVKFSHGQIVDLDKYFKGAKDISAWQWVVPKYDLIFNLMDTTIGIKNYSLQVRLDQYGQVIRMNWPKQYYTSAKRFNNRKQIEQFALRKALEKNFLTTTYTVKLTYEYSTDAFYWRFWFPKTKVKSENRFDCIDVNWGDIDDYKLYGIIN